MSGTQDMDQTQHQQDTQHMFPDEQKSAPRRERGATRPVFLSLAGLILGLLLCGIGFGFGYAAGRIHSDVIRAGGGSFGPYVLSPLTPPSPPDFPDMPDVDFTFIPGQGFGYVCEGWPEPDVEGARAWLGVGVDDTDDGPAIGYVMEDGPAALAGVETGDIILEIDGERTRDYDELVEILADHDPCEDITLLVERGRDEEEIDVTLGGLVPIE